MSGASVLSVVSHPVAILGQQHNELVSTLTTSADQLLAWQYVLLRSAEYLKTGFPGKIVLEFQGKRLNSVQNQEFIAGGTQLVVYTEKIT